MGKGLCISRRELILGMGALVATGVAGLTACAEPKSQEEINQERFESAEEFVYDEFAELQESNPAKAKSEYEGDDYWLTGYIFWIQEDCIDVESAEGGGLVVALPTDVIAELEQGQEITVCGTFQYHPAPYAQELVDAFIVE